MKNSGRVSIWTILFIVLIVLAIMGKISFWHCIFFPFYLIGGFLGLILGLVLLAGLIIGGIFIACKVLDKRG